MASATTPIFKVFAFPPRRRRDSINARLFAYAKRHPGERKRTRRRPHVAPATISNSPSPIPHFQKFRKGVRSRLFKGDSRYIHPPRRFTAWGTGIRVQEYGDTRFLEKSCAKTFLRTVFICPRAGIIEVFADFRRPSGENHPGGRSVRDVVPLVTPHILLPFFQGFCLPSTPQAGFN